MKRILVPTAGVADWQRLLAEPTKHWRTGFSAKAVAHSWEAAGGFPPEVIRIFETATPSELRRPSLLFAVPEYQTDLPGGRRPSSSDVFALARTDGGHVAIAVEGKVGEEFGPFVGEWRARSSKGKAVRWAFIEEQLGLRGVSADRLRYQLFHRTVSAILEARRFGARDAVMLVQSFSPTGAWYDDFASFVEFLDGRPSKGTLIRLHDSGGIRLHVGWVRGAKRFLRA